MKNAKTAAKQAEKAKAKLEQKQQVQSSNVAPPATVVGKTKEELAKDRADLIAKAKADRDAAREATKKAKNEEKAKAKEKREKAAAARKAEKEAKKNREPVWVTQLDEHGNEEKVDANLFPCEIVCVDCGGTRHVTKSQSHEVVRCKKCAKKYRRSKNVTRRKEKAKGYREIVQNALLLNLFPDDFRKKWGI